MYNFSFSNLHGMCSSVHLSRKDGQDVIDGHTLLFVASIDRNGGDPVVIWHENASGIKELPLEFEVLDEYRRQRSQ